MYLNELYILTLNLLFQVSLTETALPFTEEFDKLHGTATQIIHIPVDDFSIPTIEQCKDFVAKVEIHEKSGKSRKSIAIHCHQGMGRTGTFLVHYHSRLADLNTDLIV